MGRIFMDPLDDPFAAIERELAACPLKRGADAIIIDMHCEATSEKQAMGYFFDGRASLVVGTHTHAPTADHRILPGGTAFMSDVGMTGDYDSVIGMDKDEPLGRFLRRISVGKFEPAQRPGDAVRRSRSRPTTRPGLPARVGAGAARRQAGRGAGRRSGISASDFRPRRGSWISASANAAIGRRAGHGRPFPIQEHHAPQGAPG